MLATMIGFSLFELLQMRLEGWRYFLQFWNFLDIAMFFIFFTRYYKSQKNDFVPHDCSVEAVCPNATNITIGNSTESQCTTVEDLAELDHCNRHLREEIYLSIALMTFVSFKIMFFLRVFEDMGKLVMLLGKCLFDMQPFLLFFFMLLAFFTVFFRILRVEFDAKDYPGLPSSAIIVLQSYRNSIGDIAPPEFEDFQSNDGVILTLIWFIWFMNQFFILIIMLNFLIAVIS